MPANRDAQRRHRQRDDGRRGHPLQHRDRDDEGWAENGTWANLDDDTGGGRDSRRREDRERHRRREDDSFVRHVRESARQGSESTRHSDAR